MLGGDGGRGEMSAMCRSEARVPGRDPLGCVACCSQFRRPVPAAVEAPVCVQAATQTGVGWKANTFFICMEELSEKE